MQKQELLKKYKSKKYLTNTLLTNVNPKVVLKESRNTFFSKRKKEKESIQFGFTSTYIFIISVIGCLFLYYVLSINAGATKWFNIRELERDKRELQVELEKLNAVIAELESLDTIEESSVIDQMEPTGESDYLVIREGVQYVYNN